MTDQQSARDQPTEEPAIVTWMRGMIAADTIKLTQPERITLLAHLDSLRRAAEPGELDPSDMDLVQTLDEEAARPGCETVGMVPPLWNRLSVALRSMRKAAEPSERELYERNISTEALRERDLAEARADSAEANAEQKYCAMRLAFEQERAETSRLTAALAEERELHEAVTGTNCDLSRLLDVAQSKLAETTAQLEEVRERDAGSAHVIKLCQEQTREAQGKLAEARAALLKLCDMDDEQQPLSTCIADVELELNAEHERALQAEQQLAETEAKVAWARRFVGRAYVGSYRANRSMLAPESVEFMLKSLEREALDAPESLRPAQPDPSPAAQPLHPCKRCGGPVQNPAQEYCGAECSAERGELAAKAGGEAATPNLPACNGCDSTECHLGRSEKKCCPDCSHDGKTSAAGKCERLIECTMCGNISRSNSDECPRCHFYTTKPVDGTGSKAQEAGTTPSQGQPNPLPEKLPPGAKLKSGAGVAGWVLYDNVSRRYRDGTGINAVAAGDVDWSTVSQGQAAQQGIDRVPGKQGGQPCLAGTRIPAAQVVSELAAGTTLDELAEDLGVERERFVSALHAVARELGASRVTKESQGQAERKEFVEAECGNCHAKITVSAPLVPEEQRRLSLFERGVVAGERQAAALERIAERDLAQSESRPSPGIVSISAVADALGWGKEAWTDEAVLAGVRAARGEADMLRRQREEAKPSDDVDGMLDEAWAIIDAADGALDEHLIEQVLLAVSLLIQAVRAERKESR